MSAVPIRPRTPASTTSALPATAPRAQPSASNDPDGGRFTELLSAYRDSGGMARGDDLAQLLQQRQRGDYLSLARLIASGGVFGFGWRRTWWIPMFQFDSLELSVKPGLRPVLAELAGVFDAWDLSCWFADRNDWLQGRRPADVLDADRPAVLAAARADRFIAAG